jgi:hypothetical protein
MEHWGAKICAGGAQEQSLVDRFNKYHIKNN